MAERVACTGFWAAFRTATSGFETGLVAALASGRLAWLIVNFFINKIGLLPLPQDGMRAKYKP
jgi:hypothetical protein